MEQVLLLFVSPSRRRGVPEPIQPIRTVLAAPAQPIANVPRLAAADYPPQRRSRQGRPLLTHSLQVRLSRSGRAPHESFAARDDVPEEGPCQVAFGQSGG